MDMKTATIRGLGRTVGAVAVVLAVSCFGAFATPAHADYREFFSNVTNGDMEQGNPPVGYGAGEATISASSDSHSGKQSLSVLASVRLGRAVQALKLKLGTKYYYSFWYKCAPGAGIYFYIQGPDPMYYAEAKSQDVWTRLSGTFEVPKKDAFAEARVDFAFCGYPNLEILVDDFSVKELAPGEAEPAAEEQASIDLSPAAVQAALETAKTQAVSDWQQKFPNRKYICWSKSPWEKLPQAALPPASVKECDTINLAMGINEYESASFVLTNFSGKTADFTIKTSTGGVPVTLRQAMWVTTFNGKQVNDALPLLEDKISIPSGESREIWLTLYSRGTKPGDYRTEVMINARGLAESKVSLKTKVYPVSLPDSKPIYTQYWDDVVPQWSGGPELARALVKDLKQHYVSVASIHPWVIRIQVNPDGTLKEDYSDLDIVLDNYRAMSPKLHMFWLHPDVYLKKIPNVEFLSDQWKALFKSYITGLVSHLKQRGYDYSSFAIHAYDERLDDEVFQVTKLVKEADPKILTMVNSQGTEELREKISPYVDIFEIHYAGWMGTDEKTRSQSKKLLPKSEKFFWTYANPEPGDPQESPIYSAYRVAPWGAWNEGMGGFGCWVHNYKTHWNSYKHEDGLNWALVYLANTKDAPPGLSKKELVVPSKRWEAIREGLEDYTYLWMLRDKLAKSDGKVSPNLQSQAEDLLADSPKAVLANFKDTAMADAAKEKLLKVLSRFPKGK